MWCSRNWFFYDFHMKVCCFSCKPVQLSICTSPLESLRPRMTPWGLHIIKNTSAGFAHCGKVCIDQISVHYAVHTGHFYIFTHSFTFLFRTRKPRRSKMTVMHKLCANAAVDSTGACSLKICVPSVTKNRSNMKPVSNRPLWSVQTPRNWAKHTITYLPDWNIPQQVQKLG